MKCRARVRLLTAIACVTTHALFAQPILSPLGGGVGTFGVYRMETDPSDQKLYIGGGFGLVEDSLFPAITAWNSNGYERLGCGLHNGTWDCVTSWNGSGTGPVTDIEFWNGELYTCGAFSHSGQTSVSRIARWDGTAWQPLGLGADQTIGSIRSLSDGFYATGYFSVIDTVPALGLARWDGTRWHSVHDLPDINSGFGTNSIFDVCEYNGMLYIAGNFGGPYGYRISRWNGTVWEPVGNGFLGVDAWVYRMEVHDGLLYIAGVFSTTDYPGNPGSGIVAYDGSTWYDLGGGTTGSVNNAVNELLWWHDTLYIAGSFNMIGGVPSDGLARWDGTQWCSLVPPNYFNYASNVIGIYHDSLYVGGIFTTAGQDSVFRIGKWASGDYTTGCGTLSVNEVADPENTLTVWPNPATDEVSVTSANFRPDDHLTLVNALGQVVATGQPGARLLRVGHLARGLYTLAVTDADGRNMERARVVLQ